MCFVHPLVGFFSCGEWFMFRKDLKGGAVVDGGVVFFCYEDIVAGAFV